MDNTKRFSGKGAVYAKARSGYASALFAYLEQEVQVPRALFDRFQVDGRLTVPMYTVAYIGAV